MAVRQVCGNDDKPVHLTQDGETSSFASILGARHGAWEQILSWAHRAAQEEIGKGAGPGRGPQARRHSSPSRRPPGISVQH